MNDQLALFPPKRKRRTAQELRDAGMERVIDNERALWLDRYHTFAINFVMHATAPFIAEQIRVAWRSAGNPEPHHCNVYGAAFNSLVRAGLVVSAGADTHTRTPSAHARRSHLWFRGKGSSS